MKKITLAIDEDLLLKVRKCAAELGTTVDALIREPLSRLLRERNSARARRELTRMSRESEAQLGPDWKWDREAIYAERRGKKPRDGD